MSSRRRSAGRLACFGPVLPAGVLSWDAAGQPLHAAGALAMLAMLAGALVAVPLAVLVLLTARYAFPDVLMPRAVRAARRYGRQHPACPARLRRLVIAADRGRCVYCRHRGRVQPDHLIPWAWGGPMGIWNLTCLCSRHNKVKSDYWVARDGYAFYRPFPGADSKLEAAAILRSCRRARRNPLRYLRAAWALG